MLIFSEIFPKSIAAIYPEKVAFASSHLLQLLLKICSPLVYIMNLIIRSLMLLCGVKRNVSSTSLSTEELRVVVNQSAKFIPFAHQQMLLSILDLEKVTVDDIMVPRNDIMVSILKMIGNL